jgi:hypothetical protein
MTEQERQRDTENDIYGCISLTMQRYGLESLSTAAKYVYFAVKPLNARLQHSSTI